MQRVKKVRPVIQDLRVVMGPTDLKVKKGKKVQQVPQVLMVLRVLPDKKEQRVVPVQVLLCKVALHKQAIYQQVQHQVKVTPI